MDKVEWERQAATVLPKTGPKAPAWMRGDIRRPTRVTLPKASSKVPAADRKVHDRCAAAMLAGQLYSWSIDPKSGQFLVRVTESDDWRELYRHQVAELLDAMEGPVPVAEVRAIRSAPSTVAGTTWDEPVAAYLARLVHPPKRAYAAAMVAHLVDGGAMPADPGAAWAGKVRAKLARLVPAAETMAVAS